VERGQSGTPDSLGVGTIAQSETDYRPSVVAEEVADELNANMLDEVLNAQADLANAAEVRKNLVVQEQENEKLRSRIDQLKAEHASVLSMKEEEAVRRSQELTQWVREATGLQEQVTALEQLLQEQQRSQRASVAGKDEHAQELAATLGQQIELRDKQLKMKEDECAQKQSEIANLQSALEKARQEKPVSDSQAAVAEARQALEACQNKNRQLENQLLQSQTEHAATQAELAMRKDTSGQPTMDLYGESSEDKPLLAAAYQQISVLNTQLAHLYTELTLARTEVQKVRAEHSKESSQRGGQPLQADSEAEVMKQSQQIADLVSDIRHLQLDLEYHQQKLDQMIEEKQQMMRDLKNSQSELEAYKRQLEERDQLLKHRDVDIRQLREEMGMKSPRGGTGASESESDGAIVTALRAEAASKDSALIVSHYELHKEKLLRDRLEQKNLKLMERMQKLMMVVETMRKENVTLERNLVVREQSCEIKDQQLRQVTQKAKQYQKAAKEGKANPKVAKTVLDLASPNQVLPMLDRSQRSNESRSGASTPRQSRERGPSSPYGTGYGTR